MTTIALAAPSWYCTFGKGGKLIDKPEEAPFIQQAMKLVPGHGPDVDADPKAKGGGVVFGGDYTPGEPGWIQTSTGHWINWSRSLPQHFARLDRHPRVMTWLTIKGSYADHEWDIPVLLRARKEDGKILYSSALEKIMTGKGWTDCEDLADIQTRLKYAADGLKPSTKKAQEEICRLFFDVIHLGHQGMTRADIEAVCWVGGRFLFRALITAAGLTEEA